MKRKRIGYALEDALDNEILMRIHRERGAYVWEGFVVGLSEEWALLQHLDESVMRLNGYMALRRADIRKAEEAGGFAEEALRLRQERAQLQPDILLVDLPGLLSSADAHFPLVTLFRERAAPGVCHIGRILRTSARRATLRRLNRQAEWAEPVKYRLAEITRVGFGDGYSMALHEVEQFRRQEKK